MLNDMTWRKLPRDLLTNENMQWIESQLPKELAAAPYMFYVTALRQADDYGIFDLEDGVIFSKLMKIGTVRDLIKVANLMQQRRIITRVSAESNKCFINDWESPKNVPARTMAQRRQLVLDQIEEAKKQNKTIKNKFTLDDMDPNPIIPIEETAVSVDFKKNPAADFFCPENDKNAENVVIEKMDDKNAKNVDEKKEHTDRQTLQTDSLDYTDKTVKDTHTEAVDFHALAESALQSAADGPAVAETLNTELQSEQETTETQQSLVDAPNCNAPDEDALYEQESHEETKSQVLCQMQDFFVKNCYGYKKNAGNKPISEIITRIEALSDEINPPEVIASVMLQEFKKMSEQDGYWKGTPLLPAYMKKPGIWAHLLNASGKILCGNAAVKLKFSQQAQQFQAEAEAEREKVYDAITSEYLKYGIDPQDPNRVIKLQHAKAEGHSEE